MAKSDGAGFLWQILVSPSMERKPKIVQKSDF